MSANQMPRTATAVKAAAAMLDSIAAAAQADLTEALEAATESVKAAAASATTADEATKILAADAALKAATTAEEAETAAAMLQQPSPKPKPTSTAPVAGAVNEDEDNEPAPKSNPADASVAQLRDDVDALTKRVDGHDRRHENTESHLKALDGAVGIAQNKDGAWVPVPDGQFDRNSRIQQHLGYQRAKDGTISFMSSTISVGKYKLRVVPALAALLVAFLLVFAPTAINRGFWAGFTWWSVVIAAVVSITVLLLTNRTHKTASAA